MVCKQTSVQKTYVKAPIINTPINITLFFFGRRTRNSRGTGMLSMIRSEEMFNTAFVIKWFVAALHCAIPVNHGFRKCDEQLTRGGWSDLPVL
jgi:hypothetical protein